MDKILDVIKEKLESPILMNYFIGLMLFNRKVIYAALSTDYNDRVGHFYLYDGKMFNSKVEMLSAIYASEQICFFSTIYFWPFVYAVFVSIALPYLKSVSNAVHENADIFYERFRVWLNKMKTVSEEKHNAVKAELSKALIEKRKIENEINDLRSENSSFDERIKNAHFETGTAREANHTLTSENKTLQKEISEVRSTLRDNAPSMDILLKGIWKFEYQFQKPYKGNTGGVEYIKILNQCEIHISTTTAYGEYKLRCYIDRYQFFKENKKIDANFYDRIIFKKGFLNEDEIATCDYYFVNEKEIKGEEVYSNDKGKTSEKVDITITPYVDEALDNLDMDAILRPE